MPGAPAGSPGDDAESESSDTPHPIVIDTRIVDGGILGTNELTSLVAAAIARWSTTGLTAEQLAFLHSVTFDIADMPGWYLGAATPGHITIDANAAGYGWFIDATPLDDSEFANAASATRLFTDVRGDPVGHYDLLTTIMHEMGHQLGLPDYYGLAQRDNLMYGFLTFGERRLPALSQADGLTPGSIIQTAFLGSPVVIGDLDFGSTVQIKWDAQVITLPTSNQISNQATVTGNGGLSTLTDDPGAPAAGDATITAINLPDVTITVSPAAVAENSGTSLVYTFTREAPLTNALVVNFSIAGASSATVTTDYNVSGATSFDTGTLTGTITIPASLASASITITPVGDTTVEANETVIVNVTGGSGYEVGTPGTVTGTINNDDTDVSVAVAPASVLENAGTDLVYTFTRVGVTTGTLTVNFSVDASSTATVTSDYTVPTSASVTFDSGTGTGTVTFADGATTAQVLVTSVADNTVEPDETVILVVAAGANYNASPTPATGTISNDDADVTVTVSPASVEENSGTGMVFTFTRTGFTTGTLVVSFNVTGTATLANSDYTVSGETTYSDMAGTITFAAGSLTKTLTVTPTGDVVGEPDETVILTLVGGTNYTPANPTSAMATILNDDTQVSVAVTGSPVSESGPGTLVYTFTRTGDTGTDLTVNFGVAGSATLTTDYTQTGAASFTTTTGMVVIPTGSSTATVTITPEGDVLVEPDETIALTVAAGAGYIVGAPASATGTIDDDDTATISIAKVTDGAETNTPTAGQFRVTQSLASSTDTVISYTVGGTATAGATTSPR